MVVSNTGAPRGTLLSLFLFILYTPDFQYNSESCHWQKFSDDSVVVRCVREEWALLDSFVECSSRCHLILNVNDTKDIVVDFRRTGTTTQPLTIMGERAGLDCGALQVPG